MLMPPSLCRCVIVRYGFLLTEGNLATEALDAVCDGMCPACANICNCAVRFLTSNRVFLENGVLLGVCSLQMPNKE